MTTPLPPSPFMGDLPPELPGLQVGRLAGQYLDEVRFMTEIEPAPAFLNNPSWGYMDMLRELNRR